MVWFVFKQKLKWKLRQNLRVSFLFILIFTLWDSEWKYGGTSARTRNCWHFTNTIDFLRHNISILRCFTCRRIEDGHISTAIPKASVGFPRTLKTAPKHLPVCAQLLCVFPKLLRLRPRQFMRTFWKKRQFFVPWNIYSVFILRRMFIDVSVIIKNSNVVRRRWCRTFGRNLRGVVKLLELE